MTQVHDGPPPGPPDDPGYGAEPAQRAQASNLPAPMGQSGVSSANETSAAIFGARERAQIEARTWLAMQNPRKFETVRQNLLNACDRFMFADAAVYAKPVGKKKPPITGLSIRFAEEFARAWRNLDVRTAIVSEDDFWRTIESTAFDYETNLAFTSGSIKVSKFVERKFPREGDEIISSRQNSQGEITYKIRAHDDALHTATQAACAKASREAILKHAPADLKEECEARCDATVKAFGDKDPEEFRKSVVASFFKLGITEAQLNDYLGKSVASLNVAELHVVRKLNQALNQGETTWKEVLEEKDGPPEPTNGKPTPSTAKGTAGLKEALEKKGEAKVGNSGAGATQVRTEQSAVGAPGSTEPTASGETSGSGVTVAPVPAQPPSPAGGEGETAPSSPATHPDAEPKSLFEPGLTAAQQKARMEALSRYKRLIKKQQGGAVLSEMEALSLKSIIEEFPDFAEQGKEDPK